jgi:Protein of unknown function (DUF3775)
MLTISIDRIDDLLDQAAEVQLELELAGEEAASEVETASLAQLFGDEPAYQRFTETIDGLSTGEVQELVALSALGRADTTADDWPEILEETRGLPEESLRDVLARALLLSDDIETALERLGIFAMEYEDDDEEDDEDEDEDSDEEEKDEEERHR